MSTGPSSSTAGVLPEGGTFLLGSPKMQAWDHAGDYSVGPASIVENRTVVCYIRTLIMDIDDSKGFLYLHQISINATIKSAYRIKLRVDGSDVDLTENRPTSTWNLPNSVEVTESSKVTVTLKTGHKVAGFSLGREECVVEINPQEAIKQFLDTMESETSISKQATFLRQPVTIVLSLRPPPNSDTVRSELQKLQEEMNNYRHLMEDSTEKRLDMIIKCSVALSEMNPYAKAAFGLVNVTFNLLKEQKKHNQMVSDLASQLKRVLPFAEKAIEDSIEESTDLLRKTIEKLYILTMGTAQFVCEYVKKSRFKRAINSIVSTEAQEKISGFKDAFGRIVEDLDRAVDVETLKIARSIEEKLLIERLEPVKTSHDLNRCCMDGTREALLNNIVEWALRPSAVTSVSQGAGPESVYWLYGIPGVGKTSVAHSICARLHEKKRLGGSFFCRRDDPNLSNAYYVLPTLICKLAGMWRPYKRLIAEKLRNDEHLNRSTAGNALFSQLITSLQVHPSHTLVLVIDALDECGESQGRNSILSSLFTASTRVHWLKVIITSRQEQDIESYFGRSDAIGHFLSKDLKTDDRTQDDIKSFIRNKFSIIASSHHLEPDWPGDALRDIIVSRSGGLFIFVDTLWRLLKDGLDPDDRLMQALSKTSGDTLTSLYDLYSTAIDGRVGQDKKTFRVAMGTIIVVGQYRPLCDESIAQIAGLRLHVVKNMVDKLGSLLYRDKMANGGIRVRHLSILDFLTESQGHPDLSIDIKGAHYVVGIACIRVMLEGLKFNICGLESSLESNAKIEDLKDKVEQKIPDALQYSCIHWSNHICHTVDTEEPELYGALNKFVKDLRLLYWIEVLSLLDQVPKGDSSLRRILSWAKVSQEPFIGCMQDVLRFLVTFRTAIITSTPHIYISALSFTPTESNLWKTAAGIFHRLPRLSKGRMKTWPARPHKWLGHTGSVRGVVYSPNGRNIASCSWDDTVRIWDVETGALVGEPLRGHTREVDAVAYSPDGRSIVSGSEDCTIQIWDAQNFIQIGEPIMGHTNWIHCVAYSPDGQYIASGSDDTTIRIWDAKNGTLVGLLDGKPLEGHTGGVGTVACSPNVSGSGDKTLRIWDANLGDCIGQLLIGHTSWINSVSYSPDGLYIVSGSEDTTIRIWDAQTGAPVGEESRGHEQDIKCVAYSPDGRFIASGSGDHTIRIWNAETGDPVCEPLKGHTAGVMSIAYSPDGLYIVSGSEDNSIRIWDVASRAQVGQSLNGQTGSVYSVSYSPNGGSIVSGSQDGTISIWDIKNRERKIFTGHTYAIFSVACSPSGHHVASSSEDGTMHIWNVDRGDSIVIKENSEGYGVRCVAYSPDGHCIISGSADRLVRRWNAETGVQIGNDLEHPGWVMSVAYSPDGFHIVSGCLDSCVRIWDAKSGDKMGTYRGHTDWIRTVAYSPDGQRIISSSDDRTIRIWDAQIAQNNTVNIVPDDNGWVHNSDGGLLFWVPEDCRNGLACPAILTIPTTGRSRVVRVDLSQACLGRSWMGIKKADD
ncbi:WD40 repeat-like protein [Serendipita vermifera]|nr:WD40 repeat-like protein [Serendipita vermifera]